MSLNLCFSKDLSGNPLTAKIAKKAQRTQKFCNYQIIRVLPPLYEVERGQGVSSWDKEGQGVSSWDQG
jgi:hypothetical protein